MGLKTLISNLEAGSPFGAGFPNHSTPEAYNYGESTSIFDTNIESHHHFLDEETGELTDISDNEINLLKLPDVPYGYIKKGVDVIIKIKKNI